MSETGRCGFSRPCPSHRCCSCHLDGDGGWWPSGEAATYLRTGTAVVFIIPSCRESVPKPSSLQWQRWCPRRASIPTGARHETSPPNTIYRPVGSRGVAMKSRTTVSPREAWTGPLAAESCDAMPWDSARPCHPLVAIHVGLLGRSASPVQSQAQWTDIPRILSPFGRGCVLFLGIGVLQPRLHSSATSISNFW